MSTSMSASSEAPVAVADSHVEPATVTVSNTFTLDEDF